LMKSTGVVRQLDTLGRIVLPIELRRSMDLNVKDSVEIFVDGDSIVLKKQQKGCVFCGGARGLADYRGKSVCADCRAALAAKEE